MIIYIGIGLLSLGVGLFLGKMIGSKNKSTLNKSQSDNSQSDNSQSDNSQSDNSQSDKSLFQKWVDDFKAKKAQKRREKELRQQIMAKARLKALRGMEDQYIKQFQETERKKLTGEYRKEKAQKLKEMFAMGDSQNGSNNNGSNNNGSANNMFSTDKINNMMQGTGSQVTGSQSNSSPNNSSQSDRLQSDKEKERQRIIDMMK